MDELIKSISIENMLNQRRAVAERLQQAHALLLEAETLAASAHLGAIRDLFSPRRHPPADSNFLDEDGLQKALHVLDGPAWIYLMSESGNRSFMDRTARQTWDEHIAKGEYPDFTKETVTATFGTLHLSREEMFERGVIETFRRLSWDYKTNQPFKFGKRIILQYLADDYGHLNYRALDELEDLHRVCCILDHQKEPDHRDGIATHMRTAASNNETQWTGPYFMVKWYKKGTGHVTFLRTDLVTDMNRLLAKHYPNAVAMAHSSPLTPRRRSCLRQRHPFNGRAGRAHLRPPNAPEHLDTSTPTA
ncbi:MAG: DUF4942 domain-containing protein [Nitrospira sp.]